MVASWIFMAQKGGQEIVGPGSAVSVLLGIVVGAFPWSGFMALALGGNLKFLVSWALSDDQLTVRPAYSIAEAAEARGEYAAAVAAYEKLADANPADPEPRRRMAEALLKAGRPRDAVEVLRQAMRIEDKPGEQFLIALRLSEVLADDCADVREAVTMLEAHLERHPDAHGAAFARQRIARLKANIK